MTQLIVLPHVENCPDGAVIEAEEGKSICENLLANGVELDHACEMSCACTTCHCEIVEGFTNIEAPDSDEMERLDVLDDRLPHSRLGCQSKVQGDVTVRVVNQE